MQVIIVFALIFWFGYLVSLLVNPDDNPLEKCGLSYLLGSGLFTFILFIFSLLGIKIDTSSIFILLIGLIILLSIILGDKKRSLLHDLKNLKKSYLHLSPMEKLVGVFISGFILVSLVSTLYWPVNEWDALALYDFRAKVITSTGYFAQVAGNYPYFAHYPLLTSLLHAIVYISKGNNPQFVYSLQFLSFVMIFGATLRKFASRRASLLATLLVVSNPILLRHSTISYTNLPYSIYLVLGMIYLYLSMKKQNIRYLVLSGLLVGLSTWTRDVEPFWLTGIAVIVIYAFWKRKFLYPFFYAIPFFAIQLPWRYLMVKLFGKSRGITDQLSGAAVELVQRADIGRIKEILVFIYQSVIVSWGYLFPFFIVLILLGLIRKTKLSIDMFLLIIGINFGILIAGTYLFSINYVGWNHIPDSALRMAMFFIPLIIFYIGYSDIFARAADILFFHKR